MVRIRWLFEVTGTCPVLRVKLYCFHSTVSPLTVAVAAVTPVSSFTRLTVTGTPPVSLFA